MRPVFARARRMCLALPETSEASSHGHPAFYAGVAAGHAMGGRDKHSPKMFCAFEMHWGRPSIAVRVPIVEFDAQVKAGRLFATPYGRGAWTSVWVDGELNWKELTALVGRAYNGVRPRAGATSRGPRAAPAPADASD
jgi:hypothetical protein